MTLINMAVLTYKLMLKVTYYAQNNVICGNKYLWGWRGGGDVAMCPASVQCTL